jgi:hypothetical protein
MTKRKHDRPEWLKQALAINGALAADGRTTRPDAAARIAVIVGTHPEYVEGLIAADVSKGLREWLNGNGSSGDLLQVSLFPDLPVRMRVDPKRSVEVSKMTRADLDHARNILVARTQNAINGATAAAEKERAAFARFYDQVRPLLTDGKTVSDVLGQLAARQDSAA